ncbi:CD63 antigen-like [Rhinophrynus dorsalis]
MPRLVLHPPYTIPHGLNPQVPEAVGLTDDSPDTSRNTRSLRERSEGQAEVNMGKQKIKQMKRTPDEVTGVALICLGASVQLRLSDISVVLAETSSGAPLLLTITGMVIFFLSGFGAVAALRDSGVMMKAFAGIMTVIFIIEIIVGISAYSYRDKLQNSLSQRYLNILKKYGTDRQISGSVDRLQQQFQCCGAQNFTDWFNSSSPVSAASVPKSCCKKVSQQCGVNALEHRENLFREGCVTKLKSWISQHVDLIGAVGVGLGFAQIFGIIFSCLLVKILKENYVSM